MATVMPSPYDVLQVPATAGVDEIRRAHRRLAKRWHPDRCANDPMATSRLQVINAAYEAIRGTASAAAPATESVRWRASCRDETIVVTVNRLLYEAAGQRMEVTLRDIERVIVRPHRSPRSATLIVRTSRDVLRIGLPSPLAVRLAELLTARTS